MLSNPSGGATLGPNSVATVTIADDDTPGGGGGGKLELARVASTVGEADGSVVLTVRRIGASSGAVSVDYATVSGTATGDTDFTQKTGTLSWADGNSAPKTITVDVTADSIDESDETFDVTLWNPSAWTSLGSNATATVTIVDDDDDSTPNRAPVISGAPTGTVVAGSAYEFQPTVSDADGDTLTFSMQNRPVWASFNAETGRLWGTPTDALAGTYGNIVLSVSDGVASASLAPFSIAVSSDTPVPPPPEPTSTRSGGGQLGFLSLLLLGTAGLLRKPLKPSREATCMWRIPDLSHTSPAGPRSCHVWANRYDG